MPALAKLLAVTLLGAGTPSGPAITLNGVDIAGVTGQRFDNATVVIDEKGAVHIEAKGYAVRTVEVTAPPPAHLPTATPAPTLIAAAPATPAVLSPTATSTTRATARRYFLVTQQSQPDGTQYDVSVFINSQWIREVRSSEENLVMEVTKFLHPGENRVMLEAKKRGGERHGSSPDVTLRVIVGEGSALGSDVTIDDPIVDMRRNAAETQSFTEEYSLVAR